MKALFFDGELFLREVDPPRPLPGEALIRVRLAGICGTDLQILKGYSGFRGIPGHEFAGEVVECEEEEWSGRRVVGEINVTCGRCDWCRRGLGRHCAARTVMGIVNRPGAFAEYLALPTANLHEIPPGIPDEAAVFTEPLAAACEILEQVPLKPGTPVAVIGAGRLGLLAAQVLRHAGAEVTVAGHSAWKLDLARSWGLKTAQAAPLGAGAAPDRLKPRSFPVVVDATGSPFGLEQALRAVEPRGTVVMKSTFHGAAQFDTAELVVNEITLVGSRCGNFSAALNLLASGAVRVEEMISRVFPLDRGPDAFAYLKDASCLKVLLDAGSAR